MTNASVKKFLVFFMIPLATMNEWSKTDASVREAEEKRLREEWTKWSAEHSKMMVSTDVGGKTKNVAANGVSDTRNDIVIYSIVEGDSHDAVAQAFQNHPHLQIPNASIQIMETRAMGWD